MHFFEHCRQNELVGATYHTPLPLHKCKRALLLSQEEVCVRVASCSRPAYELCIRNDSSCLALSAILAHRQLVVVVAVRA